MTELLNQGLLMTVIGMGLVFLVLVFFWGLISLISRLPIKEKEAEVAAQPQEAPAPAEAAGEPLEDQRGAMRARAAAAAVAAALALQRSAARIAPPQGNFISPWQAARRGGQFTMNAHISTRKTRSSAR
ncbi:MAG: OadG family protein [Chloroflexota bacterium]|jgi:sodium pump decarboxylase gamma subunit